MDCYAKKLGNCFGRISREHVVSSSLLPEKIGLTGLKWCIDKEVFIGKNSFTIKHLCEKHNSDLSPYDTEMQKLFASIDSIIGNKKGTVFTIKGDNIEKWLLKTAINLTTLYCDTDEKVVIDNDLSLPYLFEGRNFEFPYGLSIGYNEKVGSVAPGKITFSSNFTTIDGKNIANSFYMIYRGILFILELNTNSNHKLEKYLIDRYGETYSSPTGMQYIWHPLVINTQIRINGAKVIINWSNKEKRLTKIST